MTAPVIYRQPKSVVANSGDTVAFSCQAVGDAPLTFQWYETTAGLLAGETNTTLSFTASNTQNGNGYYCIVTSQGADSTTSDTATLSTGDRPLTIVQQPKNTDVTDGSIASFSVIADGTGTISYQWKDASGNIAGATNSTYAFTAQLSDSGSTYEVDVSDGNGSLTSDTVTLTVYQDIGQPDPAPTGSRTALVWSYDNGAFSWMDASHDDGTQLKPVVCLNYGFNPGWQVRWQNWIDEALTWATLLADQTRWSDLYSAADEKNVFWLTGDNLLKSDQIVVTGGLKQYYVQRVNMDFKDIAQWTSESTKHLRQFYFHAESPGVDGVNTFNLRIGWSPNLMDDPRWNEPVVINLNRSRFSGKVKADLRTTGRYLAIEMTFNDTQLLTMTGGDMDVEIAHGR